MREDALAYTGFGWRVLPLHSPLADGSCDCRRRDCPTPAKHPRIREWVTRASADPAVVAQWWAKYPTANIGVATGDPFDAFDIEKAHLSQFREFMGRNYLIETPVADTGRGGLHILVAPTGVNSTRRLYIDGVHVGELKSTGGYVVVAPSVTTGPYRWRFAPKGMAPCEAPGWLRAMVAPRPAFADRPVRRARSLHDARRGLEVLCQLVADETEGNRNNLLFWAACRALEEGSPVGGVVSAMTKAARVAGLADHEVQQTLASAVERVA